MALNPKSAEFKEQLRLRLTPLQYHVTQERGTERAFTNKYYKLKDDGMYICVVCGQELFESSTKYDSGSGWPAFYDVTDPKRVKLTKDASHVGANLLLLIHNPGLVRTEVSCIQCGSHLGHLFSDGPKPTGKRYCINSSSLNFRPASAVVQQQKNPDIQEEETYPKGYDFGPGGGSGGCGPLSCGDNSGNKSVNGTV